MTIVIGLSGKANNGKNEVAKLASFILNKTRFNCYEVAFASAVKQEALALHGWNGQKDVPGRTLLQNIGMTRRKEDPLYWIKKTWAQVRKIQQRDLMSVIFITDCRFLNEAEFIQSRGGLIWRVNRWDDIGVPHENGLTSEQKHHPSETDLDNYKFNDALLNRTGDMVMLTVEVARALIVVLTRDGYL